MTNMTTPTPTPDPAATAVLLDRMVSEAGTVDVLATEAAHRLVRADLAALDRRAAQAAAANRQANLADDSPTSRMRARWAK